jgi:hypothetical protein
MSELILENNHNTQKNKIHNHTNSNTTEEIIKHKKLINNALKESIIKNKWFYLSILLSFYIFKKYSPLHVNTSYCILAYSFAFILVIGHVVHRVAHNVQVVKEYNKYRKSSTNKYVDYIIIKVCEFFDFHRVIHHDTSINKKFSNIVYEFINNFMIQGGLLVGFVWFYNNFIDNRVVLLWALLYATLHNINYSFIKSTVHRDHHLHDNTNYGIDIADIIFDTKWDLNDIEDHNHYSINIILIAICIMYVTYLIS